MLIVSAYTGHTVPWANRTRALCHLMLSVTVSLNPDGVVCARGKYVAALPSRAVVYAASPTTPT